MIIGDLVTILPARAGIYLIVGEDAEGEINWPGHDGRCLGRLLFLYDAIHHDIRPTYERWVENINENR